MTRRRWRGTPAAYHAELCRRLAQKPFDEIPHGLNGYSNYRCRCETCKAAGTEARGRYRRRAAGQREARRVGLVVRGPGDGVDLRLAVAGCTRNGMSVAEAAELLGVSVDQVYSLVAAGRRELNGAAS